jgi:predicted hydrocarbon binding protein
VSGLLIRIRAERREGLILEIGKIIAGLGFKASAQRMKTEGPEDTVIEVEADGPKEAVLTLQDRLVSYPGVKSLEVTELARGAGAKPQGRDARSGPPVNIERQLPLLAAEYPQIFARLLTIERGLDPDERPEIMQRIGQRVGAWVYKRDYALGGRLPKSECLKRILIPALRNLATVELVGEQISIRTSPFCGTRQDGTERCHFFVGYIEGMLREAGLGSGLTVTESECRAAGASTCVFMVVG